MFDLQKPSISNNGSISDTIHQLTKPFSRKRPVSWPAGRTRSYIYNVTQNRKKTRQPTDTITLSLQSYVRLTCRLVEVTTRVFSCVLSNLIDAVRTNIHSHWYLRFDYDVLVEQMLEKHENEFVVIWNTKKYNINNNYKYIYHIIQYHQYQTYSIKYILKWSNEVLI